MDNDKFKNKKQPELTKIKLYGSLTTKELKKKLSSRRVGGVEMGSQGGKDLQQGPDWRTVAGNRGICGPSKVAAGGLGGPTFACR